MTLNEYGDRAKSEVENDGLSTITLICSDQEDTSAIVVAAAEHSIPNIVNLITKALLNDDKGALMLVEIISNALDNVRIAELRQRN